MSEKKIVDSRYEAKEITITRKIPKKEKGDIIYVKVTENQWQVRECPIRSATVDEIEDDSPAPRSAKIATSESGIAAKRIALCLNACEHLTDEELTGMFLFPLEAGDPVDGHSPEPWVIKDKPTEIYQGRYVNGVYEIANFFHHSEKTHKEAIANAQRVVACVNACIGVTNKELDGINVRDFINETSGV